MEKVLTIAAIMTVLTACIARRPSDRIAQINAYLNQLTQEQAFSGAVLIASDGDVLLSKGYGMADVENQIPNTPQTRFRVHWITMQFTAMAILMLESERKLDVQNPICAYIPDCPEFWEAITIHHLLTHTSGLSDWIQWWDSPADKPRSSLEFVEQIMVKPPYFQPGESFRYSDNGYIVLGYIIEQVSGQPYDLFMQQRIFAPLAMNSTNFDDSEVAVGYKDIGVAAPVPDLLFKHSASGLRTTVEDLYLWDQALYDDQLVSQEYLDSMFTGYARTPSVDIKEADYGYGWFIGRVLDRPVTAHGGMTGGFTAMFLRFPEEHVTIIVLRNYEIKLYDRLEIELAQMLFGEH